MALRHYVDQYDVMGFDCTPFSIFEDEGETLFFGGDTVMKIEEIYHREGMQWKNESLNKIDRIHQNNNLMLNTLLLTVRDYLEQMKLSTEKTSQSLSNYGCSLLSVQNEPVVEALCAIQQRLLDTICERSITELA